MKRYLLGFILCSTHLFAASEMWIGFGWRQDHLDWSIGIPEEGPDILSELEWKGIKMWQISAGIQGPICQDWSYRFKGDYAKIYDGKNRDSDYLESGRKSLFSRSDNAADKGSAYDVSIALGYPLHCWGPKWEITPLIGYSRSEQHLHMRNGFQTVDIFFNSLGSFEGLNSRYETKWSSVFAGVDFDYDTCFNLSIYGSLEYHYAFYRASGYWNMRPDIIGPFHHDADSNGIELVLGLTYDLWNCFELGTEVGLKYYKSEHGVDKTRFRFIDLNHELVEGEGKGRLNPVTWHSFYIEGNLSYVF